MRNPRTLREARVDPRVADTWIDRGDEFNDLHAFELKEGFEFESRQTEPVAHERRTIRCDTVAEVIQEFRNIVKTGGDA
tara:strand:- start:1516 stop:1752 length:237 start_codon:yes stop_codon:yes gene_type:complete